MEPSRVYSNGLSLLHSKRVMDVNVLPGPMSKIKIQKTPALNVHLYIRNEPLRVTPLQFQSLSDACNSD